MDNTERSRRWVVATGLALLLPGLGGCVTVAEFRKLEDQVVRLKKEDGPAGDRARLADLSAEIADLRAEIGQLRGRVEVGEHTAGKALEEAQAARRAGARLPPTGPAPEGVAFDTPPGTGPAPAPVPGPAAAATGSMPPPAGQVARQELDSYRQAYEAWRTDDNGGCVDRFRDFLQTYPSSSYADAAAYWMADCYYKQGDYQTAILRFDDVASRYPTSDKAAEALYRQGEALLQLGPSYGGAARKAFERVIQEYPSSRRAQEADRQLRALQGG